jgi:hypothetical protein
MLSLPGNVFDIGGVWRPRPVRWLAPVCPLRTLLFRFGSAMRESLPVTEQSNVLP